MNDSREELKLRLVAPENVPPALDSTNTLIVVAAAVATIVISLPGVLAALCISMSSPMITKFSASLIVPDVMLTPDF